MDRTAESSDFSWSPLISRDWRKDSARIGHHTSHLVPYLSWSHKTKKDGITESLLVLGVPKWGVTKRGGRIEGPAGETVGMITERFSLDSTGGGTQELQNFL